MRQKHEWVKHGLRLIVFFNVGEERSVLQVEVSFFHLVCKLEDEVEAEHHKANTECDFETRGNHGRAWLVIIHDCDQRDNKCGVKQLKSQSNGSVEEDHVLQLSKSFF